MNQIVLDSVVTSRLCPGPAHPPGLRRHCTAKHCLQLRCGVLMLWWAPSSLLTPADILASYEGIRELSDGYRMPLVIHLQGMVGITAQARSIVLEDSLSARIGFVGNGPVDQVIAAFLEQALTETRYFEESATAEVWARAAWDGDAPGAMS